jgi:hypothetical protein
LWYLAVPKRVETDLAHGVPDLGAVLHQEMVANRQGNVRARGISGGTFSSVGAGIK